MLHLSHAIIDPALISIISATNEEMVYKAEGCVTKIPMTDADFDQIKKVKKNVDSTSMVPKLTSIATKSTSKKKWRGRHIIALLKDTTTPRKEFAELTKINYQTIGCWLRNPKIAISKQFWGTLDAANEILTEQKDKK